MDDLNHPKVQEFTREVAAELEIDPAFVDFVFAKSRPPCFDNWIEDVTRGWTCYVPDEFETAYPLWCTNADQTLILVKESGLAFGKGWHDCPDMEMISKTTQGLLTYLMNHMVEKVLPADELTQAAESCGYRYLDDLLKFVDTPLPADRSWDQAMEQFIAGIDEKSR